MKWQEDGAQMNSLERPHGTCSAITKLPPDQQGEGQKPGGVAYQDVV